MKLFSCYRAFGSRFVDLKPAMRNFSTMFEAFGALGKGIYRMEGL
jgi:hypothetical protein